jgi:hypothetical protein
MPEPTLQSNGVIFSNLVKQTKEFFDQLLPLEDFTPDAGGDTKTIEPTPRDETDKIEVKSQTDVTLEEISLMKIQKLLKP